MLGGARNGYCSTDNPVIVTVPSSTVSIAMTIATIGRRMKKLAIGYLSPGYGGRLRITRLFRRCALGFRSGWADVGCESGVDLGARPGLLDAVHDHPFPRLEALPDDQHLPDGFAGLDRPQGHHVVGTDDEHALHALE